MKLSDKPLITRTEINRRIDDISVELATNFDGDELLVIPVLKGAMFFAADLGRAIGIPTVWEFIRAKSYEGTRSKGTVEFAVLPEQPVTGKHVLLVEDILDTGRTTAAIMDRLARENPASMQLCVLLDKPDGRLVPVEADHVGFTICDHFVVGYGLDYNEQYRNLPDVHILK